DLRWRICRTGRRRGFLRKSIGWWKNSPERRKRRGRCERDGFGRETDSGGRPGGTGAGGQVFGGTFPGTEPGGDSTGLRRGAGFAGGKRDFSKREGEERGRNRVFDAGGKAVRDFAGGDSAGCLVRRRAFAGGEQAERDGGASGSGDDGGHARACVAGALPGTVERNWRGGAAGNRASAGPGDVGADFGGENG